jgi:ATP-dependent exoDNAse (exonuclease V) beta subunit
MFEYAIPLDDALDGVAEHLSSDLFDHAREERTAAARAAARLYRRLLEREELGELLDTSDGGEVFREVPFSLRHRETVLRGAIDTLIRRQDRIVVIDYKTGTHRKEHRLQMALYLEAARQLFPGCHLRGVVFYANGEPLRVIPPPLPAETGSQLRLF